MPALRSGRHSIKGTGKALLCIPSYSGCSRQAGYLLKQQLPAPLPVFKWARECHWVWAGLICVYMCVTHPTVQNVRRYQEERLLILRNLWPSYRTQRNKTSRQAQWMAPEIGPLSHGSYLKQSTELAVCLGARKMQWVSVSTLRVCSLERVQPNHMYKKLGTMPFAYGNRYCTINFTLKPYFCSRWHFIFSK